MTDRDKFYDGEIGLLPINWNVVGIGEVTKLKQGKVLGTSEFTETGYPVFGANGQIGWYTEYTHEASEVLVTCRGATCGTVNVSPPKSFITNNAMVVSPLEENILAKDFLAFVLQVAKTSQSITGSGQPQITKGKLSLVSIPLPPLLEQRAIAQVLSSVREAIEATERVIAAGQELKRSLMKYLFMYGPVPTSEAENVQLIELETGDYPSHWRTGRFEDFAILQRGFDITKKEQRPGTIPVVSSSGVRSYHDTSKVKGPGVVIGRKGSLGTAHYIESDYWPHDTTLWVKDFKGNHPKFLYYFLPTLNLEEYDTGTSNPTLNRNYVHPLEVSFPKESEQIQISNTISPIEDKIGAEQNRKLALESLFTGMLHHLLTGQIRVKI